MRVSMKKIILAEVFDQKMINPVATEAMYSAKYVENYLDSVDNLPNDVQRHLTRIREIDLQYRGEWQYWFGFGYGFGFDCCVSFVDFVHVLFRLSNIGGWCLAVEFSGIFCTSFIVNAPTVLFDDNDDAHVLRCNDKLTAFCFFLSVCRCSSFEKCGDLLRTMVELSTRRPRV